MGSGWWWLSFVDPGRPEGDRFLGVVVIQGTDFRDAVEAAWNLGVNPGGECKGMEIPWDILEKTAPEKYRNRLVKAPEIFEIGERRQRDPPTAQVMLAKEKVN